MLTRHGCSNTEDVVLLVSELVTNAIMHAGSQIEVVFHIDPPRIHIEVIDDAKAEPELSPPAPNRIGGRGLLLVDHVARRWGVRQIEDNGKAVWFDADG